MIAVCCGPVAVAVNVNVALLWPEATLTDAGTFTAVLLLDRLTDIPLPSAAVLSTTVHMSDPDPVIEPFAQPSALIIGTPLPDSPTLRGRLSEELLLIDSCPAIVPAALGANSTSTLAIWPGSSVNGKLAPEAVYPVPETVAPVTVTGAVPVDARVSVCVPAELTSTLPKFNVPVLTVSDAVTAFNCTEKF
jgi:hypothetical protein